MNIRELAEIFELDNESPRNFNDIDQQILASLGVSMDYAARFRNEFSLDDIVVCHTANIEPEFANLYEGMTGAEIIQTEASYIS